MGKLDGLATELARIGEEYTGKWTYALTDLTSGEHIGLDEDDVMPTASLIKVPILVALYQAVQDGLTSLTDRIQFRKDQKVLGSGVLIHMTPGVDMTVRDAATLMIIISDNVATNMMIDLVGLDHINTTMRQLGLKQTAIFQRLGDPKAGLDARKMSVSTGREMARLLELIARHEAVSAEASEDMLRIMKRQDYRHELSRNLPWNEMNRLENHRENWVAEKGGAFLNGIRCSGAVFHGARGSFVMASFCEGGTGGGSGRESEGNVHTGRVGYAAWRELAATDGDEHNRA
ncbi:MAG: serine hydrolase [Dehalococcoidia bacterium]